MSIVQFSQTLNGIYGVSPKTRLLVNYDTITHTGTWRAQWTTLRDRQWQSFEPRIAGTSAGPKVTSVTKLPYPVQMSYMDGTFSVPSNATSLTFDLFGNPSGTIGPSSMWTLTLPGTPPGAAGAKPPVAVKPPSPVTTEPSTVKYSTGALPGWITYDPKTRIITIQGTANAFTGPITVTGPGFINGGIAWVGDIANVGYVDAAPRGNIQFPLMNAGSFTRDFQNLIIKGASSAAQHVTINNIKPWAQGRTETRPGTGGKVNVTVTVVGLPKLDALNPHCVWDYYQIRVDNGAWNRVAESPDSHGNGQKVSFTATGMDPGQHNFDLGVKFKGPGAAPYVTNGFLVDQRWVSEKPADHHSSPNNEQVLRALPIDIPAKSYLTMNVPNSPTDVFLFDGTNWEPVASGDLGIFNGTEWVQVHN